MTDTPIRRLIDRSSLGTPDARLLRDSVPDETARRAVARAAQLAAEQPAASCITPDCNLWYCPTSGDVECDTHGGFDVCCDRTDLHQPIFTEHDYRPALMRESGMTDSPRFVRVEPARAIVGGVVHEVPSIETPGVTVDSDGMVRDPDGWPLIRLVNADSAPSDEGQ